jgi:hypothetical protein
MIKGDGNILAELDRATILSAYGAATSGDAGAGDFLSPQSSTALAANAFGPFLDAPEALPPLPELGDLGWPARQVRPKTVLPLPWRGGRHPCLDLVIVTSTAVIGLASRRYEPFRARSRTSLSGAYWRPVWGSQMAGFQSVRDHLNDGSLAFQHLDAAPLVKQGLALMNAARSTGLRPTLVYLYAEPDAWPEGAPIARDPIERHRQEIAFFAHRVRGDAVGFSALTYRELLAAWAADGRREIRDHAVALREHFRYAASEPLWRSDETVIPA